MDDWFFAAMTSLWLGILTSSMPCPLATNIAAITYISRRVNNPRLAIGYGALYTIGRTVTYIALGMLLINGLLSIPSLSFFLQKYMNKLLGPLLILAGMILLELLQFNSGSNRLGQWIEKRADSWGLWGAGLMGVIFALSFCPLSAALFFTNLIALGVQYQSGVIFPALFGVGTAAPVTAFAVILAFSAHSLSKAYNRLTQVEWWARQTTGALFIFIGVYYCLVHIFHIIT